MIRHLNKKYLSDDKKYKLFNKYKYISSYKLKSISNKVLNFKILGYSFKVYIFANKYFKVIIDEIIYMFIDLFNEMTIIKIEKKINPDDLNLMNNLVNNFTNKIDNLNNILPKAIEQESNKVKEVFNELSENKNINLINNKINKSLDLIQKLKQENNYNQENIEVEDFTKVII